MYFLEAIIKVLAVTTLFLLKCQAIYIESTDIRRDAHIMDTEKDYCKVHPHHFLCDRDSSRDLVCLNGGDDFYPKLSSEKKKIVFLLNELRSKVASGKESRGGMTLPQASDMLQLNWDSELEKAAANIVRRCQGRLQFQFCCQCNLLSRFEANIIQHSFYKDEKTPDWKNYFNFLKSENEDQFDMSEISNLTQPFLLPDGYLLLIRAEVSFVGCNAAVYAGINEWFVHSFVCVFGGVSKWSGFPIYSEGTPCSNCPFGSVCSKDYRVLCSCGNKCEQPLKSNESLSNNYFGTEAGTWSSNNHLMQYMLPNSTYQITDFYGDDNDTHNMLWTEDTNFTEDQYFRSQNEYTLKTDYCLLNNRHILCSRQKAKDELCPKMKKIFPQTEADKINILKVFNEYRMQVANGNATFVINDENITFPSAANFMELQWDYELETASRNLVELCQIRSFEFCCECNKFQRFSTNLLQLKLINDHVLSRHWPSWDYFLDVLKQNYLSLNSWVGPIDSQILHSNSHNQFGLLLSSEISSIGCSVAMYYLGNNYVHHPVCVVAGFSSRKNTISYLAGLPCSKCANGSTCSELYPGLCKCLENCYNFTGENYQIHSTNPDTHPQLRNIEIFTAQDDRIEETLQVQNLTDIQPQVAQSKSKKTFENNEMISSRKSIVQNIVSPNIENTYAEYYYYDNKLSSFDDTLSDSEKDSLESKVKFLDIDEDSLNLRQRSSGSTSLGKMKWRGSVTSGDLTWILTNIIQIIVFILIAIRH